MLLEFPGDTLKTRTPGNARRTGRKGPRKHAECRRAPPLDGPNVSLAWRRHSPASYSYTKAV